MSVLASSEQISQLSFVDILKSYHSDINILFIEQRLKLNLSEECVRTMRVLFSTVMPDAPEAHSCHTIFNTGVLMNNPTLTESVNTAT